jgi:hypothetical protein
LDWFGLLTDTATSACGFILYCFFWCWWLNFILFLRRLRNRRLRNFGLFRLLVSKNFICIYWIFLILNLVFDTFEALLFLFKVNASGWFFRRLNFLLIFCLLFKIFPILIKILFIVFLLLWLSFLLLQIYNCWFFCSIIVNISGLFLRRFYFLNGLIKLLLILIFSYIFSNLLSSILFNIFSFWLLYLLQIFIVIAFLWLFLSYIFYRTFWFLDLLIYFLVIIINIFRFFLAFLFIAIVLINFDWLLIDDWKLTYLGRNLILKIKKLIFLLLRFLILFRLFRGGLGFNIIKVKLIVPFRHLPFSVVLLI